MKDLLIFYTKAFFGMLFIIVALSTMIAFGLKYFIWIMKVAGI